MNNNDETNKIIESLREIIEETRQMCIERSDNIRSKLNIAIGENTNLTIDEAIDAIVKIRLQRDILLKNNEFDHDQMQNWYKISQNYKSKYNDAVKSSDYWCKTAITERAHFNSVWSGGYEPKDWYMLSDISRKMFINEAHDELMDEIPTDWSTEFDIIILEKNDKELLKIAYKYLEEFYHYPDRLIPNEDQKPLKDAIERLKYWNSRYEAQ